MKTLTSTGSTTATEAHPTGQATVTKGTNWQAYAVCRDEDPELFFPIGTAGPAKIQAEKAKDVCRRCPVAGLCLTWALENGARDGIYGAYSPEERAKLASRLRRY